MLCVHWVSCIYPVQVVSSISGNIITTTLSWTTSFASNNKIKSYINYNKNSNIEIYHNDPLPNLYYVQKGS